jgi:hypothetical protein
MLFRLAIVYHVPRDVKFPAPSPETSSLVANHHFGEISHATQCSALPDHFIFRRRAQTACHSNNGDSHHRKLVRKPAAADHCSFRPSKP